MPKQDDKRKDDEPRAGQPGGEGSDATADTAQDEPEQPPTPPNPGGIPDTRQPKP